MTATRLRVAGRALLVVTCLSVVSCEALQRIGPGQQNASRLAIEDVQAELMAFADSYTAVMSASCDRAAEAAPERRAEIHDAKLRNVQNAIIIAAGQNPVGGLLDMTVMVTLQRYLAEDHLVERWGAAAKPVVEGLRLLEREVWLIADRSLEEEQREALRDLIPVIRERFEGQTHVSSIRASDFAEDRRAVVASLDGGGSLLTLFQLDPLAGLSPAAQELAQSRLLAERAFFWAKRLPLLLNWQVQDIILETLEQPESTQLLEAATRLSESAAQVSAVAADLSEWLPDERQAAVEQITEALRQEREAALAQLDELVTAEREAALEQAFEGIATEREAILRTFEQEDVRLRGLLEEMRQTIDASTALSTALTTTVESTRRLTDSFQRPPGAEPPPPSDARPFDILDYQATAEATTVTVAELNRLLASLSELLASPDWEARRSELDAATARAQTSLEELIDRSFQRGLVLIGVLVVGAFFGAVIFRIVATRVIAPRSGGAP